MKRVGRFHDRIEKWRTIWETTPDVTLELIAAEVGCSRPKVSSHSLACGWLAEPGVVAARKARSHEKAKLTKADSPSRSISCASPPDGFAWRDVWEMAGGGVSTKGIGDRPAELEEGV